MRDYALCVSARGLVVEVRLNDVPVFRERAGRQIADENFVNEYMAAGKNVLTLLVGPTEDQQNPPADARATVELLAVDRGSQIADGEMLLQLEWPRPDTPAPPRTYPQEVSAEEDVDAPDHRSWRNSGPINLDGATRGTILKLLRELTDALDARRIDDVSNLLRAKVHEWARAYAIAPATNLADLRRNYGELMQLPDWGVEPWQDADAQMEVVGNQRLVKISNPRGRALLRSVDLNGVQLAIPTDITYVNGRLTIIR
ncbi:MAG: hypothetical protein ABIG44_05295 [Planctomycetota bacterium]